MYPQKKRNLIDLKRDIAGLTLKLRLVRISFFEKKNPQIEICFMYETKNLYHLPSNRNTFLVKTIDF